MSHSGPVSPIKPAGFAQLLYWAEKLLFLVAMVIITGAPVGFLYKTAGIAPVQGLGMFWVPVLLVAAMAVLLHPVKLLQGAVQNPAAWLVFAAILLSLPISFDPSATRKEAVFFLAQMITVFYAVKRFSLRELLDMFALVFASLALVSIGLALAVPSIGVMQDIHVGAWSGPWVDKNTLGRYFGLSLAIALARFGTRPKTWLTSLPLAGISFGLVLMSTSKTALLGALLAICFFAAAAIARRGPVTAVVFGWFGAMVTAGVLAVVLLAPSLVFSLLHRDSTLTSRTKIWAEAQRLIDKRPVRGYGYKAVWAEKSASAPVVQVYQKLQFKPVNAHSSWMDARLQLGIPGKAALMIMTISAFLLALFSIPYSSSAMWTLPSLVLLVLTSTAESVLLDAHAMESFIFFLLPALAIHEIMKTRAENHARTQQQSACPAFRQRSAPIPFAPQPARQTVAHWTPHTPQASAQLSARLLRIMHPDGMR